MHAVRLPGRGLMTAAALAAGGTALAAPLALAAPATASAQTVTLQYFGDDLGAGDYVSIVYGSGTTGLGGAVRVTNGDLESVGFEPTGVGFTSGGNFTRFTATTTVSVTGSAITGTALLSSNQFDVTVFDVNSGADITLKPGPFSIPVGTNVATPEPKTVRCRRAGSGCRATISLAGAANQPVTVRLPNARLRLVSTTARPARARGAYLITQPRRRGARYQFILNAAHGTPRGARLTLTFAVPRR
jgi:hypothetical protein